MIEGQRVGVSVVHNTPSVWVNSGLIVLSKGRIHAYASMHCLTQTTWVTVVHCGEAAMAKNVIVSRRRQPAQVNAREQQKDVLS